MNKTVINIVFCLVCLVFYNTAQAQGLLVFSNTHNLEGENQVDRKPGEINVEISSFSPITEVLVNGEPAKFK
ncbi:MAG: hypothetical protein OEY59_14025, partial [Deltaproteobacteria bacterium]|nr:hypothetical protein [Deltaproteobacteria bacterium]